MFRGDLKGLEGHTSYPLINRCESEGVEAQRGLTGCDKHVVGSGRARKSHQRRLPVDSLRPTSEFGPLCLSDVVPPESLGLGNMSSCFNLSNVMLVVLTGKKEKSQLESKGS